MNEPKSILKFSRANSPHFYTNHRRSQTEASGCSTGKQQIKQLNKFNVLNSERKFSKGFQLSKGKPDNFYFNMISKKSIFSKQSKMRKISLGFQKQKDGCLSQNFMFRNDKIDQQVEYRKLLSQVGMKKVSFQLGQSKLKALNVLNASREIQTNEQVSQKQSATTTPKSVIEADHAWGFEVERICSSIEELKSVGISDKKINNWCNCYFGDKKKGLIQVFMRRVPKKKSLNGQILYLAVSCQNKLLQTLKAASKLMSEKQKYFLGVQISLYRNFLQEKIANKHKLELDQIECRVKSNIEKSYIKQFARQLYEYDNNSLEMVNFVTDLQRVEENFGKLQLVSLKNRMRFQNIKNSELNIKKLIYQ